MPSRSKWSRPPPFVGVRGNGFRVGFSEAANGSARVEGVEDQMRFALRGETAAVRVQVAADAAFD